MTFRLFDLMSKTKTTQVQLAQAIGASQGNISDWKNGRSFPKSDVLARIADYFNVTTDYLLGRTDAKSVTSPSGAALLELSPQDTALLDSFHQLNEEGQEKVLSYAKDLTSSGNYIKSGQPRLGEKEA